MFPSCFVGSTASCRAEPMVVAFESEASSQRTSGHDPSEPLDRMLFRTPHASCLRQTQLRSSPEAVMVFAYSARLSSLAHFPVGFSQTGHIQFDSLPVSSSSDKLSITSSCTLLILPKSIFHSSDTANNSIGAVCLNDHILLIFLFSLILQFRITGLLDWIEGSILAWTTRWPLLRHWSTYCDRRKTSFIWTTLISNPPTSIDFGNESGRASPPRS